MTTHNAEVCGGLELPRPNRIREGLLAVRSELVQLAAGASCVSARTTRLPRLSAWLGAPVWFNGWRESVTVQVSRPIARVVIPHLSRSVARAVDRLVAKAGPGPRHDAARQGRRCLACMMWSGVRRREHTGGTRYPTASMPFSRGKAYTSTTPWDSAAVHRCARSRPEAAVELSSTPLVLAKRPRCAPPAARVLGGATMINGPSARRSVLPATTADPPSHGGS